MHRISLDNGGIVEGLTEFPIFHDLQRYRRAEVKKLGCIPPEAKAIIQSLQPHNAGKLARKHPLWTFYELSNMDKHRAIHLVILRASPTLYVGKDERPFTWYLDQGVLKRGAEIVRFNAADVPWFAKLETDVNVQFYLNPDIAFQEGPAARLSIDGVLSRISDVVGTAIDKLIVFVLPDHDFTSHETARG